MVEKKETSEKKPTWTMDVMILSNLNEIAKYVDESAVKAEGGDINAIIAWRAGLREFYRNLKSFLVPVIDKTIWDAFNELDKLINPVTRQLPTSQEGITKVYLYLDILTTMLYQARNDLFMRFIELISPLKKAYRYALGSLPKEEQEKIIAEKLKGKETEESNPSGNAD